ncbi:hypothetical protein [Streptomyces sp. SudanB91_2054]|uniref:hypothetical protein n=1 Tax=Streptomyces sp. SudanB91_2054 TaxID=3035278 RepID=UPI0036DE125C
MRWSLIALTVVLLATFPNLLSLLSFLAGEPLAVAFVLGATAGLGWARRPAVTRLARRRR